MKKLSFLVTAVALPGMFVLGPLGMGETVADAIEGTRPFAEALPWIAYFAASAAWLIHISHPTNH